jgi:glyoxylase-like metal-dependent hydrolase (beta-lactamase superfamily II)/rhodanese-related sulfurtransferase
VIVHQFYLGCLAHASYLVADETSKTAVVVDPQRDIDIYLEKARELGVEIKHVLLTHFHADFVAGHLELREKTGAAIYIGAKGGGAEYEHVDLTEGDTIEFGDVRIVAMETPGHTPEGISYLLYDLRRDAKAPHAVFTGDTLFVGDVGRPDLLASIGVTASELGQMLYHSLHEKLMKLPDETLVYPAHGAGSMCGKNLGSEPYTTIGKQRTMNYALQPMSEAEFVALVTADQPQAPKYFGYDAMLNRQLRGTLDEAVERGTRALSVDEFLALREEGAQVIDTRESADFGAGTVKGAFHLPIAGSFATWAGALLDLDKPVLVIAEPGKEEEAAVRMARVGLDTVVGYLEGGFAAIAGRSDLVQTNESVTVEQLRQRLAAEDDAVVLDVRTPGEFEGGHIEGAQHLPLIQIQARWSEVPRGVPVYVICRSGHRSSTALSVLGQHGYDNVVNVIGGMNAWNEVACEVWQG